jgi:hypothetical protein
VNIAELTVDELMAIIRRVVEDVLREHDPDFGLELRPDVEERLRGQLSGSMETVDAATAFRAAGVRW